MKRPFRSWKAVNTMQNQIVDPRRVEKMDAAVAIKYSCSLSVDVSPSPELTPDQPDVQTPFFRSFANLVQDEALEVFILEKEKDFKYGQGKTIVAIAAGGKNAVGNEVKYVKWYNLYGGDADKTSHKLQPIDKTYTYGIDKARQFWDEKIQEGYDRVK